MKAAWLAALSGFLTLTAIAQQPADKPAGDPKPVPGTAQPEPTDRAGLRARAERRLADAKRQQERWEAAIKKLDAGAPVEEVDAEMRGPRPPQGSRGPDTNRGQRNGNQPGGPRPDAGPDHGPGLTGTKLTREEVLDFLGKEFPEISKRFTEAMKEDQGRTSRILDRMEPRIRELLAEHDPEMRGLRKQNFSKDMELLGASKAFFEANRKNASAEDTKKAGDTLRKVLGEHFDLQIKIHEQEIVMLERRVEQLRKDLSEQLPKRDEFIDKRLKDIERMSKEREQREPRGGGAGGGAGAVEGGGPVPNR